MSRELEGEMLRSGVPAEKIARIPNGVDLARFAPAPRHAARAAGAGPVIVVAGRLVPRKRVDLALAAFAEFRAGFPGAELHVLGDGPERVSLEARANALGIAARVRWLGGVDDPERRFREADAFLHAADREGLPNALLEAMACGLPVAAPRIGGIEDAVADGVEGILYEGDEPRAVAGALRKALALPRSAPRARVERQFSADRVAEACHALYRGLQEGRA